MQSLHSNSLLLPMPNICFAIACLFRISTHLLRQNQHHVFPFQLMIRKEIDEPLGIAIVESGTGVLLLSSLMLNDN